MIDKDNTVLYLCSAFEKDPDSYEKNVAWTLQLMAKGYTVINPILNSKPIHDKIKDKCEYCKNYPECRKAAIDLCNEKGSLIKWQSNIDYLKIDLGIIRGYCIDLEPTCIKCLKGKIKNYICEYCGIPYPKPTEIKDANRQLIDVYSYFPKFQPKIILVFAPNCISSEEPHEGHLFGQDQYEDYLPRYWVDSSKSYGANEEYLFGVDHQIRRLILDDLLEDREVEI